MRVDRSEQSHEAAHSLDPLAGVGDLPGCPLHRHDTLPSVLEQPALERPAAFRTVRIDAAARPLERAARLDQQRGAPAFVLDLQPQDLEPRDLGAAAQLDVGEQRPVTAQAAPGAQGIGEAGAQGDVFHLMLQPMLGC